MKLQTLSSKNETTKNLIIDKMELPDTKIISNRSNMKLSTLTRICYKKKYCYLSIAVQRNSLVGFLYKIFIKLVFIGWLRVLYQMNEHKI